MALVLGLAACQKGFSVFFSSTATLVNRLMEARDVRQLARLQAQLTVVRLLIIDELGYVPLSQTGAELLFEVFSQRYERAATIVTSTCHSKNGPASSPRNGPPELCSTGLPTTCTILKMNGESYRYKQARAQRRKATEATADAPPADAIDLDTGEIAGS